MIIKAKTDQLVALPETLWKYAFTQDDQGKLDISTGKSYIVYAAAINKQGRRYLIYTDGNIVTNMWWMPAELFDVVEESQPKGWQTRELEGTLLTSYPSLFNWKVSEGIIDGQKAAMAQYLLEANEDPTFPNQSELDVLNRDFNEKQAAEENVKSIKMAKERGWELPPKS